MSRNNKEAREFFGGLHNRPMGILDTLNQAVDYLEQLRRGERFRIIRDKREKSVSLDESPKGKE